MYITAGACLIRSSRFRAARNTRPSNMASSIAFVLILSLVVQATFSLPVSRGVATVQSSNSLIESASTVLSRDEEIHPVLSVSTETVPEVFTPSLEVIVKRTKREIVKSGQQCPSDMFAYGNQCLTKEQ